ncbi:helix-turn-helix transcriptional regulator [Nocardioides daeguensis]|uniref:helix-turn-helix transcriptional regulator n=1 Tax=Nocardioides daeguensis TaxID=908359 RepID=UPI001C46D651|nr:helix-turn-helix domain-containing protein [Nocardioides daeguensis]MBV6728587.1 helix-turn-helix domain-containing protein [Nocardioides daeguensis]MCR1774011.1 helix-turn-helix domain-containing protein [Nocardioides daeguensis]
MSTTKLGLEPLIGVEELAEYLGVPVQTIYDWRLSGRAPRAFKLGKHLRFAVSDVQAWLDDQHEPVHDRHGDRDRADHRRGHRDGGRHE